ncbi:phage/plasmid primase, P4 family [Eubacteriaceae bacterium ES3]|nr:phage/plasmid primase, P4 family [Eubacteriaceae bacterium ES3]
MTIQFENIPKDLTALHQWVLRRGKVPVNPHNGYNAKAGDPSTWGTFNQCGAALMQADCKYDGIGFQFNDNGIVGIDIDHCIDEQGIVSEEALKIVNKLDSYTEISPSGTGLHLFVYGDIPKNSKKGIELYKNGRYFTVTGNVFGELKPIQHREKEIKALYDKENPPDEKTPIKQNVDKPIKPDLSADKIIDLIRASKQADKFNKLYAGDLSDYINPDTGETDHSSGDFALCSILAFWCGGDTGMMDQIFRTSGLMRDKWDRKESTFGTYGNRTINEAVSTTTSFYSPPDEYSITFAETENNEDLFTQDSYFIASQKSGRRQYNLDRIYKLDMIKPEIYYTWDDKGFGGLFAYFYKDNLRYNTTAKSWMYYDGKVWKEDTGGMFAARCGKDLATHLNRYAWKIQDNDTKEAYVKETAKLGKKSNRESMISDARDFYFITNEDLDKDIFTFNCLNGTLNLKTFEFKDHSPDDLLSKISNVIYNPDAKSPEFEQFLDDVMMGDTEKIRFLQKLLGHSLTGEVKLETCFMLYGATTRNGKSTLVETFAYMLGSSNGYSRNMKPETLALKKNNDSRQASGDIARLNGCRFLNVAEPPKRMVFDVALLKTLLGRDTITARHLYQAEFEFVPIFKLFINTNFLPLVTDDTLFSSGRINVITFDRHFEPEEQDKGLKDRLIQQSNISGLLNWCIEGLKLFYEEGAEPPETVQNATGEYRSNSDKIGSFLCECMVISTENSKAKDVYDLYQIWCNNNGYGTENKSNFFSELKAKGLFANSGTVEGKTVRNVVVGMVAGDEETLATVGLSPVISTPAQYDFRASSF